MLAVLPPPLFSVPEAALNVTLPALHVCPDPINGVKLTPFTTRLLFRAAPPAMALE
jgi:hypothetical protein